MILRDIDDGLTDCPDTSNAPRKKENKEDITFINTNARLFCPKIHSLIDSFDELQLTFATIIETWLVEGEYLEEDLSNLALGVGVSII